MLSWLTGAATMIRAIGDVGAIRVALTSVGELHRMLLASRMLLQSLHSPWWVLVTSAGVRKEGQPKGRGWCEDYSMCP